MGISPIDLQVLYSQLDNVSKQVAQQQQGKQLSDALQKDTKIQENLNKINKVHELNEQNKSGVVSKDGKNNNFSNSNKQQKKETETLEEINEKDANRIKESYLGNYIDITG